MTRKADHTGILRRGSACLSCRRRKLRCDGARPVCMPCSQMKRTHECKYDDSGRKSRTQTLREKMATLEAKVRELESGPVQTLSPTSGWSKPFPDMAYNPQIESPSHSTSFWEPNIGVDQNYSTAGGYSYMGIDQHMDFLSGPGSSSSSDASMSRSLGIIIPLPIDGQPIISPLALTDSSGTPVQDSISERFLSELSPSVTISRDQHETLIQTFINHKKQCCFYSNTRRFDPSSSPTTYQSAPPNSALMSAIYLLGSFFAPGVQHLEQKLLEQTLQDVSRSLHNQEQPLDMIQALSLLAQYFFFNNRDMEGNRHLSAAKRIAFDCGLHQLSPAIFSFDLDYAFDGVSQDWSEKSAVFWQTFMVNNFWSASVDCCIGLPSSDASCHHITTPLPVTDETPTMELLAGNSPLYALFDVELDLKAKSLNNSAFKVMASSIFDRSLRVHNTSLKDDTAWAYRRSAEVALDRLNTLIQPVTWADSSATDKPFVDTDLYAVHSLIVASTIHLHLDNNMDLKLSWAARKIVELVNHLTDGDYQYLDPVLSVCWSSIVKVFRRMIDRANEKILISGPGGTAPWIVTYLESCVNVLLLALQNMSSNIPLADSLLSDLDNTHSPLHPGLNKMLPPFPHSLDRDYIVPQIFAA